MNKKSVILASCLILSLIVFYFVFFYNSRENKLTREGNRIVNKIENYRKANGRLPSSLTELGITIIDESNPPLYYEKRDNVYYTVSFGTSLGESKTYYSDSKKWEDGYRNIGNVQPNSEN